MAYMSGYHADCFDQTSKDLRETAILRTKELFDGQMLASVNARECTIESSNPQFEMRKAEYALFPAWFMTFRYQDKPYTMLVNGQTGKLVGTVPFDKKKVIATLIGIFVLSACVLVPLGMAFVSEMSGDEDFIKLIFLLLAGAFWMGKDGLGKLYRIRMNEKLTSATNISHFAHDRQKQQGGTYE